MNCKDFVEKQKSRPRIRNVAALIIFGTAVALGSYLNEVLCLITGKPSVFRVNIPDQPQYNELFKSKNLLTVHYPGVEHSPWPNALPKITIIDEVEEREGDLSQELSRFPMAKYNFPSQIPYATLPENAEVTCKGKAINWKTDFDKNGAKWVSFLLLDHGAMALEVRTFRVNMEKARVTETDIIGRKIVVLNAKLNTYGKTYNVNNFTSRPLLRLEEEAVERRLGLIGEYSNSIYFTPFRPSPGRCYNIKTATIGIVKGKVLETHAGVHEWVHGKIVLELPFADGLMANRFYHGCPIFWGIRTPCSCGSTHAFWDHPQDDTHLQQIQSSTPVTLTDRLGQVACQCNMSITLLSEILTQIGYSPAPTKGVYSFFGQYSMEQLEEIERIFLNGVEGDFYIAASPFKNSVSWYLDVFDVRGCCYPRRKRQLENPSEGQPPSKKLEVET